MRLPRLQAITPGPVSNALSRTDQGWRIASGHQWGYAAVIPFGGFADAKGTVEVKLRVANGRLGISLLTDRNEILHEQFANPSEAGQTVTLPMGDAHVESVLFRSGAPQDTTTDATIEAADYVVRVKPLAGAAPLQKMVKVDPLATLDPGPPLRIVTGQKWGFAAQIPITLPSTGGLAFVRVHARVMRGRVGIGTLDKSGAVAKGESFYEESPAATDYFVAIPASSTALLFRSDIGDKSEIVIEDVTAFRIL